MALISFGDIPALHAARLPSQTLALHYPDRLLTWRELDRRANQRARLFRSLGVAQDDFVTIALPNSSLLHEVVFATWKLGATANVISSRFPEPELQAVVDIVRPGLIVGGAILASAPCQQLTGDEDIEQFSDHPMPTKVARYWRAQTSGGSTGRPKVIVDHMPSAYEESQLANFTDLVRMKRDGVILNPGPLYHTAPFTMTHHGMLIGNTIVGMASFDAEEMLRLVDRHAVDWISMVPTMMNRISALPSDVRARYCTDSLRTILHVGAPCPPALKQLWIDWLGPERIWELYAGTERVGITMISGTDWLRKPGSVGKSVDHRQINIIDDGGAPLPPGKIGEIRFDNPDGEPPSHYLGDHAGQTLSGSVGYGDLGYLDEDGFLFLVDRRTDLILRGGANIYPAEIEAAIAARSDIVCSVVVGLPDDDLGARVHAIIEPAPGAQVDLEELHAFLTTRMASYKLPESFEIARSQLRDDAGKVRRTALRDERIRWLAEGKAFRLMARRKSERSSAV